MIPNTHITVIERCSGHDGTWEVKSEHFADSMKIGKPVFNQMVAFDPDYISSDCAIAARHIQQGIDKTQAQKMHPLTLLRIAYGNHQCLSKQQSITDTHRITTQNILTTKYMPKISRESLMTLEAYAKARQEFRSRVIAHKKNRTIHLGNHFTLLFEDELTIRYQIQEMLRIEKIFDEEGILQELDAYNPLIPDRHKWKATMMIEYADPVERAGKLTTLIGIEDSVWIKAAGHMLVFAIADEDLDRKNEEKTSSIHFLRFEFSAEMIQSLHQGIASSVGVDHPTYQALIEVVNDVVRNTLLKDLVL